MALKRPFYQLVWLDSYQEEGGTRFYAVDDAAAVALAERMAGASRCQVREFYKVEELGPITSPAPVAGSNIQDKSWFFYQSALEAVIKVSVPSLKPELLELPRKRTAVDRIGGLTALVTRNGTACGSFVKGLNNYGVRKRDLLV